MRTITKITNVYQFEELSDDTQQIVLDKYRDWMVDDPYWYTCITEDYKDKLTELGIEKPEIYFSGFWNQGDGAVFECKDIDLIKLMDALNMKQDHSYIYKLLQDEAIDLSVGVSRISSIYSHEKTARFNLDLYLINDDELTDGNLTLDEIEEKIHTHLNKLGDTLEYWRMDTCKEIYQALEQEYEMLQSDDVLKEIFIENEYEFTEDGEIYN